jgi:hypothetical protein
LQGLVLSVRIIDSENDSTPPPVLISGARCEVDEGFARFEGAERRTPIPEQQPKAKLLVNSTERAMSRTAKVTALM